MSFKILRKAELTTFILVFITACAQTSTPPPISASTPLPIPSAAPTNISTVTPPTQAPFYISATVWQTDPVAPILLYHNFKTNRPSTLNIVSRLDFQEELEKLYASDYVTVSLEKWLAGDLRVPEGKRPLVMSMDDVFYRNQIVLTSDGTPSDQTGLGLSWKFSKEHPDFGFHWALFANLGDKPFGVGTDAEQKVQLANVIVWCLENDAMVYNHTYRHTRLGRTTAIGITSELKNNDVYLRKLLALVNRQDLIPKIGNLIALPAGQWPRPDTAAALYGYINPEGVPLQAILDVDFIVRPNFMAAPYAAKFDQWKLPRMVANLAAVKYLTDNKATIPTAQKCEIGPLDEGRAGNSSYIGDQILSMVQSGKCPKGIYAMENFVFRADTTQVELLQGLTEGK